LTCLKATSEFPCNKEFDREQARRDLAWRGRR